MCRIAIGAPKVMETAASNRKSSLHMVLPKCRLLKI